MKCKRVKKSVGGLKTASTITSGIGNTALAIAPFTGPAAPIVGAVGGALSLAGMGMNLGAENQQDKLNKKEERKAALLMKDNYYNTAENNTINYIPTLNATYKYGGSKYRDRFNSAPKYKLKRK